MLRVLLLAHVGQSQLPWDGSPISFDEQEDAILSRGTARLERAAIETNSAGVLEPHRIAARSRQHTREPARSREDFSSSAARTQSRNTQSREDSSSATRTHDLFGDEWGGAAESRAQQVSEGGRRHHAQPQIEPHTLPLQRTDTHSVRGDSNGVGGICTTDSVDPRCRSSRSSGLAGLQSL